MKGLKTFLALMAFEYYLKRTQIKAFLNLISKQIIQSLYAHKVSTDEIFV